MSKLQIVNVNVRKHLERQILEVAPANISLSKQQLAGKLASKSLSLVEKVKFLDFAKANSKFGCRKLAVIFKIGKAAAANILKKEKTIRSQHELFCEKFKKRYCTFKYWKINKILYEWYQRCASNIYPNGPERGGGGDQRKTSGK